MLPRPLSFEQLVRCLERRFGPVTLAPDSGPMNLSVAGELLSFFDAERLCLGEVTLEELKKAHA